MTFANFSRKSHMLSCFIMFQNHGKTCVPKTIKLRLIHSLGSYIIRKMNKNIFFSSINIMSSFLPSCEGPASDHPASTDKLTLNKLTGPMQDWVSTTLLLKRYSQELIQVLTFPAGNGFCSTILNWCRMQANMCVFDLTDNPACDRGSGQQTAEHVIYVCSLDHPPYGALGTTHPMVPWA